MTCRRRGRCCVCKAVVCNDMQKTDARLRGQGPVYFLLAVALPFSGDNMTISIFWRQYDHFHFLVIK